MSTKLWLKAEVVTFLLAALSSHLYSHCVLHSPENLAFMYIPHTLPKLRKKQSCSLFSRKIPSDSCIQSMCNNTQSAARCPGGHTTPVRCPHWHPQYVFVTKVLSSYFKLKFSWYFLLKLFHLCWLVWVTVIQKKSRIHAEVFCGKRGSSFWLLF